MVSEVTIAYQWERWEDQILSIFDEGIFSVVVPLDACEWPLQFTQALLPFIYACDKLPCVKGGEYYALRMAVPDLFPQNRDTIVLVFDLEGALQIPLSSGCHWGIYTSEDPGILPCERCGIKSQEKPVCTHCRSTFFGSYLYQEAIRASPIKIISLYLHSHKSPALVITAEEFSQYVEQQAKMDEERQNRRALEVEQKLVRKAASEARKQAIITRQGQKKAAELSRMKEQERLEWEKAERIERALAIQALRQRITAIPSSCVYVVQLTNHTNTIKIGHSTAFAGRRLGLRSDYGPIRYLLAIPHEAPHKLERNLHERFAAMRLYKGASSTELFQFSTKRQQRFFERFLAEHPTCCIEQVAWQGKQETKQEIKQQILL